MLIFMLSHVHAFRDLLQSVDNHGIAFTSRNVFAFNRFRWHCFVVAK